MRTTSKSRASEMFTPQRMLIARKRLKLTAKAFAEEIGVSTSLLSKIETGKSSISDEVLEKAAQSLGVSTTFLTAGEMTELPKEAATFRSMARMTAASAASATAAASYAFELSDWLDRNYNLPSADIPNFSAIEDPEKAAQELRAYWGIGERPITDVIRLLESKGVRVFALSESDYSVDAYSCWRDDRPYVLLNTIKSGEHTVFDTAHELGHLVLHRHGASHSSKNAEYEANAFASAFLMPERDVRAEIPRILAINQLIEKKHRWKVSLAALVYRLRKLGKLTEARYRSLYIQMGKRGYRKDEPSPMQPLKSTLWDKVLTDQWQQKRTLSELASDVDLPEHEVSTLTFRLGEAAKYGELKPSVGSHLRLVQT